MLWASWLGWAGALSVASSRRSPPAPAALPPLDGLFYAKRAGAGSGHNATTRLDRIRQLQTFFDSVPEEGTHALLHSTCHRRSAEGWMPETCAGESPAEFRFYCPSPEAGSEGLRYRCINSEQLCNLFPDCPGAEDEDLQSCMFFLSVPTFAHALF